MSTTAAVSSSPTWVTAIQRVKAEYTEMPGLRLTLPQAERLLGLDRHLAVALFGALEQGGFLRRTPTGFVKTEGGS